MKKLLIALLCCFPPKKEEFCISAFNFLISLQMEI